MILDVGCGSDPKGDINIDIKNHKNLMLDRIFVLADAHNIPFKDKVFSVTVAFHVIEHLKNPLKALKEMARVTEGKVILRTPSEMTVNIHTKEHLFKWGPYTLANLLKLVFPVVETGYTSRQWIREYKFARFIHAWVHVLLGKMGFSSEIYAICTVRK